MLAWLRRAAHQAEAINHHLLRNLPVTQGQLDEMWNFVARKHAREMGKGDLRLSEEAMEYLLLYRWPGNVRQIANEMRRLAALAEPDAVLMPEQPCE